MVTMIESGEQDNDARPFSKKKKAGIEISDPSFPISEKSK
jgi:hypothetical protein